MTTKEEILQNCIVEGTVVKLPNVQLERKIYQEVAKDLQHIGGKWKGGKVAGFVFPTDPTDLLSQIAKGEKRNLKKEFQFFETPETLADKLVELADIQDNDTVLEPSAGQGAIIKAIRKINQECSITAIELMPTNYSILMKLALSAESLDFEIELNDFLKYNPNYVGGFTKIIANPPFSKNQDIAHLKKMYECLAVGGRIVCITSEVWTTGSQKKHIEFREWLAEVKAEIIDIEKGSFKESGTMVGGKIIIINESQKPQLKEPDFSVGDKVDTPYGLGEVWKVTEASIHVKHYEDKENPTHDPLFSKYLKEPRHHSQKPISSINHI